MERMTTGDLWTAFGDRLRRYIAARVRNEHDAEDILQDIFTRLQRGIDGVEDLEAWLFQVTRNAVADHFRKRGHPVELKVDPAGPEPAGGVTAEVASWLAPMMELLDAPDREALRLVDLEGLGQKELAERLGLSVTGAKSRVQRARKHLKEILLDCCDVELDRRGNALSYTPRSAACSDSCSCG
jgi:RNA polymerase sigma-70 factor, ECF subfamily